MKTHRLLRRAIRGAALILPLALFSPLPAQPPPPEAAAHVRAAWRDRDDNGWNDAWELCFPAIRHRDPAADTDGDGVSDYREMLGNTMPFNKIISKTIARTPAEQRALEAAELARQAAEEQRMLERGVYLKQFEGVALGVKEATGDGLTIADLHQSRIQRFKERIARERPKRAAAIAKARAELQLKGIPEMIGNPAGNPARFAGSVNGEPIFHVSYNTASAATIKTNQLNLPVGGGGLGLNLTGAGVVIGHWDGADILETHGDLAPKNIRFRDMEERTGGSPVGEYLVQPLAERQHATHTAGTLAGTGSGNSSAAGMAPGAFLATCDSFDDITEMEDYFDSALLPDVMAVSSHSYGIGLGWEGITQTGLPIWLGNPLSYEDVNFGLYTEKTMLYDQFVWGTHYCLPVFAAGNDRFQEPQANPYAVGGFYLGQTGQTITYNPNPGGNQPHWQPIEAIAYDRPPYADGLEYNSWTLGAGWGTLSPYGCAFNVLTVASVADNGTAISTFSGAGPSKKRNIKPDVAANGESVTSAWTPDGTTAGYAARTGTSQAAPAVAGSIALLLEQYRGHYGPTARLWASTLKGMIIHTADDVDSDGNGQGNDGPDYRVGYGIVNARKAAELVAGDGANGRHPFIKQVLVPPGNVLEIPLVAAGGPLRVTLCWTEEDGTPMDANGENPPETPNTTCDFCIVPPLPDDPNAPPNPDVLPWQLDVFNPSAPATTGPLEYNNVGVIDISNAIAGKVYTAHVDINMYQTPWGFGIAPVAVIISGAVAPEAVEYKLASFEQVSAVNRTWALAWHAEIGESFRVETSTDLTTWTRATRPTPANTLVPDIIAFTPGLITQQVQHQTSNTRRFWRVRRLMAWDMGPP